jgi:hypothetical protein
LSLFIIYEEYLIKIISEISNKSLLSPYMFILKKFAQNLYIWPIKSYIGGIHGCLDWLWWIT